MRTSRVCHFDAVGDDYAVAAAGIEVRHAGRFRFVGRILPSFELTLCCAARQGGAELLPMRLGSEKLRTACFDYQPICPPHPSRNWAYGEVFPEREAAIVSTLRPHGQRTTITLCGAKSPSRNHRPPFFSSDSMRTKYERYDPASTLL
jgi:hypothetical protein